MPDDTFGSPVYERLQTLWILHVYHVNQSRIDPSPRFNAVETAYHHGKLHVVCFILVLDLAIIRGNIDTFDPPLDEGCSAFGF